MKQQRAVIIDHQNDPLVFSIDKYSKSLKYDIGDFLFQFEAGQSVRCKETYHNPLCQTPFFRVYEHYHLLGFNIYESNTLLFGTMLMASNNVHPVCLSMNLADRYFDLTPFKTDQELLNNRFYNLI